VVIPVPPASRVGDVVLAIAEGVDASHVGANW
jgi:hypothetical protein